MTAEEKLVELVGSGLTLKQMKIGRFDLNYAVAGAGPAVLLLHGANIGWGQWHLNIRELSRKFTVYALDLPGSGQSTGLDFKTADLEKDLVDSVRGFVSRLNLEKVSIIAHSLGGWIALRLALRDRDLIEKLVLVSPVGVSGRVPLRYKPMSFYLFAKFIAATAMRPTRANIEKFLKSALHKDMPIAPEFVNYFYEAVRTSPNRHPLMLIHRLSAFWAMNRQLVLLSELHKIHQPVLIIGGEKDPVVSAADLRKAVTLFPRAELEILSAVGHVPPMEAATAFNRRVADFIGQ